MKRGTVQLLRGLQATNTALTFGDMPAVRESSDAQARFLPALFSGGGLVSIADVWYEGDVEPRPTGNQRLTASDWVQVSRFDTVAAKM